MPQKIIGNSKVDPGKQNFKSVKIRLVDENNGKEKRQKYKKINLENYSVQQLRT